MVLDDTAAAEQLRAGALACPGCGRALTVWGYARPRSVRGRHGLVDLHPRRSRCRPCRTTHVLLPASCLPRRAVTVDIVGAALLAKADGASHQAIAADLDLPADTVRGWVRRATATATWLHDRGLTLAHQLDPMLPAMSPPAPPWATRWPPWQLIALITGGATARPTGPCRLINRHRQLQRTTLPPTRRQPDHVLTRGPRPSSPPMSFRPLMSSPPVSRTWSSDAADNTARDGRVLRPAGGGTLRRAR